jgi:redox-sensitive bicupin YhaK (pirin superfamily)
MTATTLASRRIVQRTRGSTHGPITRLMSPSDLGQRLKPFIFLDLFSVSEGGQPPRFGMHPHSGIATLTYLVHGDTAYEDATGEHGERGVLPKGGVEWMMAGGGVWHKGAPVDNKRVLGFQLWVAMPPELELAPAYSRYLGPSQVPQAGPVKVLQGQYGDRMGTLTSPIPAPSPITYLAVQLKAGDSWRFEPPAGHHIAWTAVAEGKLSDPSEIAAGDMVVFDESTAPIEFTATTDAVFVLGSGARHPHDMHMGYYSVHTSARALEQGEAGINSLGVRLRAQGRL